MPNDSTIHKCIGVGKGVRRGYRCGARAWHPETAPDGDTVNWYCDRHTRHTTRGDCSQYCIQTHKRYISPPEDKRTLAYVLDSVEREGATHIKRNGGGVWMAYRPAPGFPGKFGSKVLIRREHGWVLDEPWVLIQRDNFTIGLALDNIQSIARVRAA